MALRVLVVDDSADMRALARAVIDLEHDIDVVGESGDPYEALEQWRLLRPDVVVLDERLPVLTGLQVAARILLDDPAQPIVIFTAYGNEALEEEAGDLGVCTVLSKDHYRQLPDAIRDCAAPSAV